MRIDILTLFPGMFRGPFDESIVRRAIDRGDLALNLVNIRDFSTDSHRTVDDTPYGGGPGMVLKAPPIFAAVESVQTDASWLVLLSPRGQPFRQAMAAELAARKHLVLICGHYEGVDERVRSLVDDEISIGDFVITGGELAAAIIVDAVARLLPGVLGADASLEEESHRSGVLEYPHYTRPQEFRGMKVPEILLSGDHAEIAAWRREQALRLTSSRRPDLMDARLEAELQSIERRKTARKREG